MCDIPRILLSIFGIRILDDCRVYWLSFFGSFLAINYFVLMSYTIIYFANEGRFIHGTRCLCGVGIVSTSLTLYVKCLSDDRFKLKNLFRFSGDYIYKDLKDSSSFTRLCDESIENMRKSYIFLVIVIFISIGGVIIGPIDAYLRKGVMVTPFGTKLPFFEENSSNGFYFDMTYQSILMPFGIISTICIELCQCMTYNTVQLCADVIELSSTELSIGLEAKQKYSVQSRARFRNMLMQIKDFDE